MSKRGRRLVGAGIGAGVLGGIAYAAWRAWRAHVPESSREIEWGPAPFPFPPVPRPVNAGNGAPAPEAKPELGRSWVPPNDDGTCPPTHPIKAKESSGIYHVPGGANYERTKPDRCYADEAAAEADGMRRAKF